MKKYLRYNSLSSLAMHIMEVLSGLVLPRFILLFYGSETNGMVSSVTQFLSVIGFLDMGTTAVVTSSLYQPIADKNQEKINQIISAARSFFRKIAYVLIAYVAVLIFIFPWISDSTFDRVSTATLIIAMAIGTFSQYYIGLTDQIFLSANQREYIYSLACTVTIILNTLCSIGLIYLGMSIQVVKLATSLIYLLRPLVMRIYIKRHYELNRRVPYSKDAIPQRWNGVAQHTAFRILTGTDTIVLTIFSSISNVSIYAVYHMVVNGVYTLLQSLTNGIKARMGTLWADRKYEQVKEEYKWYEWLYHMAISFVFGCVLSLLVPFIMVYTSGVTDADYFQPIFAVLITLAFAALTMGQFGVIIIQAVNHYKQTQIFYIISAVLNIVISIVFVIRLGLIGVAIGTLVAMLFQYGWTQWYMAKKLFHISISGAIKQIIVDALIIGIGYLLVMNWGIDGYTYIAWLILAIKVALVYGSLVILVNFLIYRKNMLSLSKEIINRIIKRNGKVE